MALQDFRAAAQDIPVTLTLGAGNSVIEWLLMPSAESLREQLPAANLVLRTLRSREAIAGLHSLTVDLAVLREDAVPGGIERTPTCEIGYMSTVAWVVLLVAGAECTLDHSWVTLTGRKECSTSIVVPIAGTCEEQCIW